MASETRQKATDLIASNPPAAFSYAQLMRLLCLEWQDKYGGRDAFLQRGVHVIPYLSLSFPPSDIVDLETTMLSHQDTTPDALLPTFTITATFM